MILHTSTADADLGWYTATVVHTATGKGLHTTSEHPSRAAARQAALAWIHRLALAGVRHTTSYNCRRCPCNPTATREPPTAPRACQ